MMEEENERQLEEMKSKEATEEEIEEFNKKIPEWKKGQMVTSGT